MSTHAGWFEVDKEGLAKLLRRKGLAFVLYELVQNAWDTKATNVQVKLEPIPGRPLTRLRVEDDDPDGFKFLNHGYVLYAESVKKADPTKRGRFNIGEKLVLAACETAKLASTTGTVYFERTGGKLCRRETREKLAAGSIFEAEIKMTRAELDEVLAAAKLLIPPVTTILNGERMLSRDPVRVFEGTLPTEVADEEGFLRRTARKTEIKIYTQHEGASYIYEMGIPVVDIDLPWSVDIGQKIPLNADRDNVTPAYRKALGVLVLNEMHQELKPEDARRPIIQEALESADVDVAAVNTVITHQYGDKRTVLDPSDPEANNKAFAHGYNVIPGGAFSKEQWANIKRAEAALPSGRHFPSPKLYGDGPSVKIIDEDKWSDGMRGVADFYREMGTKLMGRSVTIVFEGSIMQPYAANYGGGELRFNTYKLGKRWFDLSINFQAIADLMIHEFGHEYSSNHLDTDYYKALTRLGAKLTKLALSEPETFRKYGVK